MNEIAFRTCRIPNRGRVLGLLIGLPLRLRRQLGLVRALALAHERGVAVLGEAEAETAACTAHCGPTGQCSSGLGTSSSDIGAHLETNE